MLKYLNAMRNLGPNVSNSAITQSVTQGMHFASKQSIMALTISSLFLMEKLIKLVSIRTWNGGPNAVLCWKNSSEGYLGLVY